MPYNSKKGYVPLTFDEWMFNQFMPKINQRYKTSYTAETFVGTQWYDILYPLIQGLMEGDAEFADVWVKLTEFFDQVNARINNPACVPDGIIEEFERMGIVASLRPVTASTAGKIGVCIFADTSSQEMQAKIAQVMTECVAGGIWPDGDKSAPAVLNNGQTITWRWCEPTEQELDLRMRVYYTNSQGRSLPTADEIAQDLREKIGQRYRYGTSFVPEQMYQTAIDAPYAVKLKLEWSVNNGDTWSSDIRTTPFNEKLIFDNISVLYEAI